MYIAGLQKMTLLDFPGKVACTVFLSGCNFRCPFCHNSPLLGHAEALMTDAELLAFLKKRRGLLDGVCITGGEPTLSAGLPELLRSIRALGYPVKLDTNGSRPEVLKALVEEGLVQYVAMDIKNSPARYALTTGTPNNGVIARSEATWQSPEASTAPLPPSLRGVPEGRGPGLTPIEESIRFLLSKNIEYELRTTVASPLHDVQSISDMGAWLNTLGGKPERFFLQNYVNRESVLRPDGLSSVDKDTLDEMLKVITPYVIQAAIRGQ